MRINTPKFMLAVALLLSAMQSCNTAEDQLVAKNQETIQNQIPEVDYRVDMQFVGARGGALSKAYLASNKSDVLFSDGEKISVFDGQYNNEFVAANGGAEAEFAGKALSASTYYMLNPYQEGARLENGNIIATVPLQQRAVADNFDPEACVSVAKCSNGQSFELLNVGAIARLETTEPFAKIVLKTLGEEKISGTVSINPETAVSSQGADYVVSLLPAEGKSEIYAGVYFMALLPATLQKGAQLEFYSADGSVKTKTFATTITITKSKGINFGKIQSYDEADEEEMTLAKAKTPQDVFKAMGLGWNLGNHCDAYYLSREQGDGWVCSEAYDKGNATQELFNALAAAGIKTVRIPVTWWPHSTWDSYKDQVVWEGGQDGDWKFVNNVTDAHSKFTGGFVIMDSWLKRVHEIVTYAKNAGLNAIVNIHHDGSEASWWLSIRDAANNSTYNDYVKKQIKSFWTQIATELADEGEYLIFEGFNEIHDGEWNGGDAKQWKILDEWEALFVKTIRDLGGNNAKRWLSVPSYQTTPEKALVMNLPLDNRLMVAVHYYAYYLFSLKPVTSGQTKWGDMVLNNNTGESYTLSTFQQLKTELIDKGIPMYIGEIGCVPLEDDSYQKYRLYMLEYCSRVFHDCYMAPILWDNRETGFGDERHGYFDHVSGAWINESYSKPVIDVMKKAVYTNDDPSYTLDYIKNHRNPAVPNSYVEY